MRARTPERRAGPRSSSFGERLAEKLDLAVEITRRERAGDAPRARAAAEPASLRAPGGAAVRSQLASARAAAPLPPAALAPAATLPASPSAALAAAAAAFRRAKCERRAEGRPGGTAVGEEAEEEEGGRALSTGRGRPATERGAGRAATGQLPSPGKRTLAHSKSFERGLQRRPFYSRGEVKELADIFAHFDADANGELSKAELAAPLRAGAGGGGGGWRERAAGLLGVLARDPHQQTLRFHHLLRAMALMVRWAGVAGGEAEAGEGGEGPLSREERGEVRALFDIYDTDRNGVISRDEFFAAAGRSGLSEEEAAELFGRYDDDGNKLITLDEFTRMCRVLYRWEKPPLTREEEQAAAEAVAAAPAPARREPPRPGSETTRMPAILPGRGPGAGARGVRGRAPRGFPRTTRRAALGPSPRARPPPGPSSRCREGSAVARQSSALSRSASGLLRGPGALPRAPSLARAPPSPGDAGRRAGSTLGAGRGGGGGGLERAGSTLGRRGQALHEEWEQRNGAIAHVLSQSSRPLAAYPTYIPDPPPL
eukprot:tig00001154_g7279.t1